MKKILLSVFQFLLLAVPVFLLLECASVKGAIDVELGLPDKTYISPGIKDGIQDTLGIPIATFPTKNILITGYRFTIMDGGGAPVRVISGGQEPPKPGSKAPKKKTGIEIPEELVWDGRNDEGELAADGEYSYQVEAWDDRGNSGKSRPLIVVVDNLPPYVEVSVSSPIFSPDGDGKLDTVTVFQRASTEELKWQGAIRNSAGDAVKILEWAGRAQDFNWDGRGATGTLSPDGKYSYLISCKDLAGNRASYGLRDITVDTRKSSVTLDVEYGSFSPNGDGKRDTVRFFPVLSVQDNVQSWGLGIYDDAGEIKRSIKGTGRVENSIVFDGRDDEGEVLPDGAYRATLRVLYRNQDNPQAVSPPFTIDTTHPYAAVSSEYLVFSPDGDGLRDTLAIYQSTSVEARWEGSILDSSGNPVTRFTWEGRATKLVWDGKNESGRIVADGLYTYRLTTRDEAENSGSVDLQGIRVDSRPTPVSVSSSARGFSPNGDGIADYILFNLDVRITEGIRTWSLAMVNTETGAEKTFKGGSATLPPSSISWDGKNEKGTVKEGAYYAMFRVDYEKGNAPEARTAGNFLLDISPPELELRVQPRPFSPDGDGVNDTVTVSIAARDKSPLAHWAVRILDPVEKDFIGFSGGGAPPKSLIWNGLSTSGELVQSASDYPFILSVVDELGNGATAKQSISIDILVMRDGDNLKIVISSIYFKPYTADYTSIDPERAERNIKNLNRLAEMLKKYGAYKIRIEGHAVREHWDNPRRLQQEEVEELQPLSRARAEVIRNALVDRGIRADRMSTAGYGGTQPIVPHSDLDNRWKNRRVEFILVKE